MNYNFTPRHFGEHNKVIHFPMEYTRERQVRKVAQVDTKWSRAEPLKKCNIDKSF